MNMNRNILSIIVLFAVAPLLSQQYELGISYYDSNEYVEYIHGNIPLIISAPHGGEKKPSDIPDRSCNGCVYVNDTNTQELAREIADAIFKESGCYPHVILNRLHRSKLDANRAIREAADGDPTAEVAWQQYTDFINIAKDSINANFDKGLFIDLHGHAHDIQRLELGYLLSKNDLKLDDEDLSEASFVEKSSIKDLILKNPTYSLADFIRGEFSLGTDIERRGFDAVPSLQDLYPEDSESYFSGGYNTATYGSRNGGSIDAIQIECNQDVRFQESVRKGFAESLAQALKEFLELFYTGIGEVSSCYILATEEAETESISMYPNPVNELLYMDSEASYDMMIIDVFGRVVYEVSVHAGQSSHEVTNLEEGCYTIYLHNSTNEFYKKLLILR